MCRMAWPFMLGVLAVGRTSAAADVLVPSGDIELVGELVQPEQLSGIALAGDFLVLCPDEKAEFNVLRRTGGEAYEALEPIRLLDGEDIEIDLEGAAADDKHLYLLGSHSLARRSVEASRSYAKNRERITEIKDHEGSDNLFQLKLTDGGGLKSKDRISLHGILKNDEILGPFTKIPSKENGIDLEGIAVQDKTLYVGFRGPVYRAFKNFRFRNLETSLY